MAGHNPLKFFDANSQFSAGVSNNATTKTKKTIGIAIGTNLTAGIIINAQDMFHHITAIVSGGASGLGAATASYLVRNGARVLVADLPQAQEQFLKLEASVVNVGDNTSSGGSIIGSLQFAKTDVRSEDDVSAALDMAEEEFGEQG